MTVYICRLPAALKTFLKVSFDHWGADWREKWEQQSLLGHSWRRGWLRGSDKRWADWRWSLPLAVRKCWLCRCSFLWPWRCFFYLVLDVCFSYIMTHFLYKVIYLIEYVFLSKKLFFVRYYGIWTSSDEAWGNYQVTSVREIPAFSVH